MKQTITPFLWFNDEAGEAVKFYTKVFKKSKVLNTTHYGEGAAKASGKAKDSIMTIEFELNGLRFVALNGGPHFKINEGISFVVSCETQAEINRYWKLLSAGGKEIQCGWLKDKFGVTWQIVPSILGELLGSDDPEQSKHVMQALLKMKKLELKKLKQAAKKNQRS